jgi:hypothetical protein
MSLRDGFQALQVPVVASEVSPAALPILTDISKQLEATISYWPGPSYPVDLPSTCFPPSTPSLVDAFRASDPNVVQDLKALAWDSANGRPRRLDDAQLAQLAESGEFDVPSKYPPHSHKWKVAQWLQKGRAPTHKSFEHGLGKGLFHVLIGVPDRLVGNAEFSVRRGLSSLKTGGRRFISLSVGLSETSPKYSPSEVQAILLEQENDHVKERLERAESAFDTRIFDNKVRKQYGSFMEKFRSKASEHVETLRSEEWIRARKEVDVLPFESAVDRNAGVDRLLNRRTLEEAAKLRRGDANVPPQYGDLWTDRERLDLIVSEVEEDMRRDTDRIRTTIRQQLVGKHPILSTIPEWLERRVEERVDKECNNESYRLGWYGKVPDIAHAEGIGPMGAVYRDHIMPFRLQQVPGIRAQLEQERKPARVFSVSTRIWRPKNWIKVEDRHRSLTRYFPQKHRILHISTDERFWRLSLLVHESRARLNNGLYGSWQALWNGPFGVKSMFYHQPFVSRYQMNCLTGEIIPDDANRTRTFLSRLRAVWDEVARIRRDFEAKPDTGLLGKPFARVLNVLSAYIGIGIPGTAIVLLGQPLLTVLQLAFAVVVAATSPVWAPLSGVVEHALSMTIYDFHHPHDHGRWFPLLSIVLWDLGLAGVAQASIALLMGLVVHPALAMLRIMFESLRRQLRIGYDRMMWLLLLRRCRIPSQDSFIAWRIAGPGITADYFFQIKPDIALLVLAAKLEECELDLFIKDTTEKINEPMKSYNDFFKDFGMFGLHVSIGKSSQSIQTLRSRIKAQHDNLSTRVSTRQRLYTELTLLALPDARSGIVSTSSFGRIRQCEQDLDATLRKGKDLVAKFCERLEKSYTDKALLSFWFNAKVLPGDYGGLVKHLLSRVFGEPFWTPMESSDATIVIPVEHKTLESLIHDIMSS